MTMRRPLSTRRAVFAGCVRDCRPHLPGVLANLEALSGLFGESGFVLVESDSRDGTKAALKDWGRGRENFHLVDLDGLEEIFVPRTLRLAAARNHYLEIVRGAALGNFDYLFVMDFDDVCEAPIDLDAVRRALAFLESDAAHAGAFANQEGIYYDLWALRHPELCPGDIWFDMLQAAETHGIGDQEAFRRVFTPHIFSLATDGDPIEVESCFGGFGIYKMAAVRDATYCGMATATVAPRHRARRTLTLQTCEHVALNRQIGAAGGRLFILPYLINGVRQLMPYPPSDCRTIVIDTADAPLPHEAIA